MAPSPGLQFPQRRDRSVTAANASWRRDRDARRPPRFGTDANGFFRVANNVGVTTPRILFVHSWLLGPSAHHPGIRGAWCERPIDEDPQILPAFLPTCYRERRERGPCRRREA